MDNEHWLASSQWHPGLMRVGEAAGGRRMRAAGWRAAAFVLGLAWVVGCNDSRTPAVDDANTTSTSEVQAAAPLPIAGDALVDASTSDPTPEQLTVRAEDLPPVEVPEGMEVTRTPGDNWPLFRGNPQGTGVSDAKLPDDPQVIWKRTFENGGFESTPIIVDGVVYVGCYDGNFYALRLDTGETIWHFPTELGFNAPAAYRDGRIYVGDTEGRFFCLDAATGEPLKAYPTNAEINAAANFYEDSVIFGSQDASLYRLRLESLELVWKFTIDDMIQCAPTIVENLGFIAGCDGRLHIVNLDTGMGENAVDIYGQSNATPSVMGDLAYGGTHAETFLAVDWRRAQIVWEYRHAVRSFPYQSSAAVLPEIVVVGGRDKMLHGLDPYTGQERWTFMTKGRIDGSPVIVDDRAFVGSGDGRMYAVDVHTGERLWEYEAGGDFIGSAAVVDGHLVIGTAYGDLYCFGEPQPE